MSWDKRFLALSLVVLVVDGVWAFHLAPSLLRQAHNVAEMTYESDGNAMEVFPGPQVYSRYTESHRTRVTVSADGVASMEFITIVHRLPLSDLYWTQSSAVEFDPDSLEILGQNAVVMFPPDLAQRNYNVKMFSYLPDEGVEFRFQNVDEVKGLATYVYDFNADGLDWTENYNYTLPPEVRIKSRTWGTVWIEPVTGTLVNHEEQWTSSIVGGAQDGLIVDEGAMWFAPDTITKQVFLGQNTKRASILYEKILSLVMLAVSAVLAAMAFVPRRKGPVTT